MSKAYLTRWACRAADKINGVKPARYGELGNLMTFVRRFPEYSGPFTWEAAYGYLLKELGEDVS
jgi:hypothetical protein